MRAQAGCRARRVQIVNHNAVARDPYFFTHATEPQRKKETNHIQQRGGKWELLGVACFGSFGERVGRLGNALHIFRSQVCPPLPIDSAQQPWGCVQHNTHDLLELLFPWEKHSCCRNGPPKPQPHQRPAPTNKHSTHSPPHSTPHQTTPKTQKREQAWWGQPPPPPPPRRA